jgi:hypothetical protein
MEEWGNGRANAYYEANVPANVIRPKEGDPVRVVERYIRDKYEHKRYVASSIPPKSASAPAAEAPKETQQPIRRQSATTKPEPAPVRTPASAPAPKPAEPSLLDFAMEAPAPAPTPVQNQQVHQFNAFSAQDDGFGAFSSAPQQQSHPHAGFDAFSAPAPVAQTQAPAPQTQAPTTKPVSLCVHL